MFAKFLKEPSIAEASAASLPPRLLQLLPAGAKVAGRDSHLLENSAGTAHRNLGLTAHDEIELDKQARTALNWCTEQHVARGDLV
jgi:hypothetical protein